MTPQVRANPYPYYAELRQGPVCQIDPGGMWAVSRYDDVVAVLRDPQHFSSGAWADRRRPAWLERNAFGETNLVTLDPPDHTKIRNLISPAFGPAAMNRLESEVRLIADDLAERVTRQREVDFIADFALPLPQAVICRMLGLDPALGPRFKQWTTDTLLLLSGASAPDQIAQIRTSLDEMERYFTEVIEARRRKPENDMVTDLILARVDGSALTHEELLGFLRLLLLAGLETTVHLLGNAMTILSSQPQVAARLFANRDIIPSFLEEVLRYEPPAHSIFRRATAGAEVAGASVPEGALVIVLLASALHDERHFPHAESFLLDRDKQGHLSFGQGIHFCVGAALARMEARLGLEALFSRIRSLSRLHEEVSWTFTLNVRGPAALPIRFESV